MSVFTEFFAAETIGLVACGGKSSRMGADKSMLVYHDKPQREIVYDMLIPLCGSVFLSCHNQQSVADHKAYAIIKDLPEYEQCGPISALLTAFEKFPQKNVLLIGCDYPFLQQTELDGFLQSLNPDTRAAAFFNEQAGLYEPLLAYYHHSISGELKAMFSWKEFSLQQLLKKNNAAKYIPLNSQSILSIDTPEQFEEAKRTINSLL